MPVNFRADDDGGIDIIPLPVDSGFIPIEPGKGKGESWEAGSEGRDVKILSENDPPTLAVIQSCPNSIRVLKIFDVKPGGVKVYTHMDLATHAICPGPSNTFLCYRNKNEITQLEFKVCLPNVEHTEIYIMGGSGIAF